MPQACFSTAISSLLRSGGVHPRPTSSAAQKRERGRGHLYRALLGTTAYGIRHILEVIGRDVRHLVAVGGGTKDGLWTQIVSDVIGLPQDLLTRTIGAGYGDAFLAALAADLVQPDARRNPITATVQLDPTTRTTYGELYRIYRQLYPATMQQMHQLATLQESL